MPLPQPTTAQIMPRTLESIEARLRRLERKPSGGGEWTEFDAGFRTGTTPVSLGSGGYARGIYRSDGTVVDVSLVVRLGAVPAGNQWGVTLPAEITPSTPTTMSSNLMAVYRTNNSAIVAPGFWASSSGSLLYLQNPLSTNALVQAFTVNASSPFAWNIGSTITIDGSFRLLEL